jgi:tRNA pseudouridine38-40 synthase
MPASYRLVLEYDGTRYRGWQEQTNARSVAGELRRAIEETVGEKGVELGGSGRTDAGVHALAQVAHLRLARTVEPERLRQGINDHLPADIHLLAADPASPRFHARHHAVRRSYLYQVSRRRAAFAKRYVWWVKAPLDAGAMAAAAARLPGLHDFARFCERPGEQASTLVKVEEARVGTAGDLILIRLVASHFLWKMVRRLVGTMVEVGAGRLAVGDFAGLLAGDETVEPAGSAAPAARPRAVKPIAPAAWTAPPSGLFLERVLYPGDPPLGPLVPAFPVPAVGALSTRPAPGGGGRRRG